MQVPFNRHLRLLFLKTGDSSARHKIQHREKHAHTHTHTQKQAGEEKWRKKKDTKYKGRIQRACTRRNRNNNNNTLEFQTWTNKNAEEKLLHSPNAFLVEERMREATSKQFWRHCAILNHLGFLKLLHCTSPSLLLLFSSFFLFLRLLGVPIVPCKLPLPRPPHCKIPIDEHQDHAASQAHTSAAIRASAKCLSCL